MKRSASLTGDDATGLVGDSKAQAEQVRSVAVERIEPRVGMVPVALVEELDEAPRIRLGL